MSNPHCVAFADAYGEAEDAGRTPMNWQIRTVGNVGSIEDYTQPWGLVADLRIFRDRALGRQELKAIRRGVEATLPAAPAASDLVAPYDLTPGREYNAPPMDDY